MIKMILLSQKKAELLIQTYSAQICEDIGLEHLHHPNDLYSLSSQVSLATLGYCFVFNSKQQPL